MELPKKYAAQEMETAWQAFWNEKKVYAWDPARGRDDTFVVDTPPPTVSGSLHVGHLFSYSHQDFIVRYQRMRGKNIFFPIGWDDNGLPTERRVQNLYNVKCEPHAPHDPNLKLLRGRKGDPLPINRTAFIKLCEEVTREDEAAFRHLWTRLGLSYDWDQEYATIDAQCRAVSQLSFLDLLEKGEIYQQSRPVIWDVDFQTAIAQAEVEDRERPGAYHYLKFDLADQAEKHLVVATTRPELLAACVAVLVHPDDERYRQYVGQTILTPVFRVPVPLMADEKADPEKGTGVVMVCTFGDQTDVEWWRQYNLPLRNILGTNGHLLPVEFVQSGADSGRAAKQTSPPDGNEVSGQVNDPLQVPSRDPAAATRAYDQLVGKYVKPAQRQIAELAALLGYIVQPQKEISHAVKFFEKGERPLELIPARQWYTKIMDKKDALLAQGRKIKWHPEYMSKRYDHWVEGLNQDWCLSRQRYFGVPVPVWYRLDAVGQPVWDEPLLPERDRLPVDPLEDVPTGYRNAQRDQPDGFTGDPDVLDTWATSSLTPQIASGWLSDAERHGKLFPMDIRPQSHEIIRTWAFYTIVKAYLHENEIPWHNVVISGWILDPDRKKMSKSQGNVVTPEPLIDQYGADSVRYWAGRARLGVDTAYDEQVFNVGKKLCMKLFNASKFVIGRFQDLDQSLLTAERITTQTDLAMVAELRPLIERVTKAFDQFDYAQSLGLVEEFFWGTFCDNYLELAKSRTYEETLSEGRLSACATLRILHRALVRMFAPFIPYITEELWQWLYAADKDMHPSVHCSPWPMRRELDAIPLPRHPQSYEAAVLVMNAVRRAKAEANLSMAAPVANVIVRGAQEAIDSAGEVLADVKLMLRIENADLRIEAPESGFLHVEVFCANT